MSVLLTKQSLNIAILTIRLIKGYGVDIVVDQQASLMSRRGHRVTVFTTEYDPGYFSDRDYRVEVVPKHSSRFISFLKKSQFDVIIAHTSPFFEILPALRPYKVTIAYEHGDPTPSLFPKDDAVIRQNIKDYKRSQIYPEVDSVIAISRFIAEDIGWPQATIIYNGADHLKTDNHCNSDIFPADLAEQYNISEHKIKILCVSRLGRDEAKCKGFDLFVKFKKLLDTDDRYEFIILGKGTTEDKSQIEQYGIKVILNASAAELIAAYKLCDIFVSFSKWEGFNLPLVEAQSYGKPAFAIDWCCHKEVTPLVFSGYETIAYYIMSLSRDELITLGKKCQKFVSKFTWQQNVSELIEFLANRSKLSCQKLNVFRPLFYKRFYYRFYFYKIYSRMYNLLKGIPLAVGIYRFLITIANRWRNIQCRFVKSQTNKGIVNSEQIFPPCRPHLIPKNSYKKGLVSICILSKNKLEFIKPCMESLVEHTDLNSVEILIGDTGSTDPNVFEFYKTLPQNIRLNKFGFYNFSINNNVLAREALGEYILFLNNDTKVTQGWLEPLIRPFQFERVGIVGPKLLFKDGTIQHAGVEIFTTPPYRYVGWHPHSKFPSDYPDANILKDMPGVTGACLAIRHDLFNHLGGFDEDYMEECQDMDLCLQAREQRYRVIYTPHSTVYHYENGTRTRKESHSDRFYFQNRWKNYIETALFTRNSQSEPWRPLINIELSEDLSNLESCIVFIKKAKMVSPNIHFTIKTEANQIPGKLNDALIGFQVRIIPAGYEDNHMYDHIIKT